MTDQNDREKDEIKQDEVKQDSTEGNDVEKETVLEEVKKTQLNSPTPGKDLLMGIGISAAAYGVVVLLYTSGLPMTYVNLTALLILCSLAVLIVKFYRMKRTNAAVIMIVLLAPAVLFLLLVGSCALLFMGL